MRKYTGLTEIRIITIVAEKAHKLESIGELNSYIADGWELLDISTLGPDNLPGDSSRMNYFRYHLGKFKEDKERKEI